MSSSGNLGPLQEQNIMPCLAKGAIDLFVPPAGMPEFDDVAARGIKLADNLLEPGLGVAIARRQLKQKASHAVAKDVGDHPKIPNERLCAFEPLDVSDVFADLDGVNELLLPGLASPGLNACNRRPRVEGCVDFDGVEAL